jgi:hypothetical protein
VGRNAALPYLLIAEESGCGLPDGRKINTAPRSSEYEAGLIFIYDFLRTPACASSLLFAAFYIIDS